MKEVILLKNGEIALKGLNRHAFEDRLIKNARRKLMPVGSFHFRKAQSTIYVEPDEEGYDLDEAVDRIGDMNKFLEQVTNENIPYEESIRRMEKIVG